MEAKARLFLNQDKTKLLPEGHEDGAFLYAAPGDEIPGDAAKQFGLVDGDLPKAKAKTAPANKAAAAPTNKGAAAPANKAAAAPANKPAVDQAAADAAVNADQAKLEQSEGQ